MLNYIVYYDSSKKIIIKRTRNNNRYYYFLYIQTEYTKNSISLNCTTTCNLHTHRSTEFKFYKIIELTFLKY
jgi:hypothetical protein